ncbi:MAG: hypothetical protein ABGX20_18825 [Bacillus sp. (in: firmicutes)]
MESKLIAETFVDLVMNHFNEVKIKPPTHNRPNRISLYVPNKNRNKRWMQIDWNTDSLSIAMDHLQRDITEQEVKSSGIPYGDFNGKDSRIRLNNDSAVFLTIFPSNIGNLITEDLISFLEVHYNSYLRRVGRND